MRTKASTSTIGLIALVLMPAYVAMTLTAWLIPLWRAISQNAPGSHTVVYGVAPWLDKTVVPG